MTESSIKYGALVLFACIASVLFPKADLVAAHEAVQPDRVEQLRPVLVDVNESNEMVKHWGVRARG